MPNWTYNSVTPDDDAARKFIEENCLDDKGHFTFNKMIPCPKVLNMLSSPQLYIEDDEDISKIEKRVPAEYKHLIKEGIYIEFPEIPVGRVTKAKYAELIAKYGAGCWYDWRLKNWGCKWDASSNDHDEHSYWFTTPWSIPDSFMQELAKRLPKGSSIGWCAEYEEGFREEYTLKDGVVHLERREDIEYEEE